MSQDIPWYHRWSNKFANGFVSSLYWPGDRLRGITAPFREKNKSVYYHRKLPRITPIEECEEDDALCIYEANEQYNRDRTIDEQILVILRQRMMECSFYYGQDKEFKCKKETDDLTVSETNYFAKYGDLGIRVTHAHDAFRKQQHRMIWERRNKRSLIDGKPFEPIEENL